MKREIIIKFLRHTAILEEQRQVLVWLAQPGAKKALDEILKTEWDSTFPKEEDETDYQKLLQQIHFRTSVEKKRSQLYSIAPWSKIFRLVACFVLLVASMFLIKKGIDYKEETPTLAERTILRKTGLGEKLTLKLPDGTGIVLNANSSIKFSSGFGKTNRFIELTGEGYFEIAKDSLRPFQVQTGGMRTTALGTEFNAYARDGVYAVALTEGKVAIEETNKKVELKPGQRLILDKHDPLSNFKIEAFEFNEIVGWKEGILNFDRVALRSIFNDLEKWYDVKITIEEGFKVDRRVIGTFRNKNLSDVLTGLGFSMEFEFSINKNQVMIKKNSQ
ncbi:FecR family protein [Cyclobacterium qasimii]|uniref:Anti-sigma factor n=1 Tax=Cyclobacterium qasimii TaxID=1350429 RepID=A0A512C8P0_9BACT|nr:FecR domain-containing protein [Cyclobacterium qasimii]GEO20543.1 anti-sigma factor [Cyclobacterium qasimii]